ncbi:hypothetical protein [Tenacibaculum sp. SG-28]|nr:hypothetical protein [Tenacibaculum sp. SG-28]
MNFLDLLATIVIFDRRFSKTSTISDVQAGIYLVKVTENDKVSINILVIR